MPKTKKLDRKYVDHVASLLRPILDERFGGNHTAMAKAMKVSQPQLSAVLKKHGGDRGAGIVFLLAVRDYLGDRTLDEILGLEPPEFVRLSEMEAQIDRALDKRLGSVGEAAEPMAHRLPPPVSVSPVRRKRN
jgi:hypothetical protein